MNLLQAILVRVRISNRPYRKECTSVPGHSVESTHMLLAMLETVLIC